MREALDLFAPTWRDAVQIVLVAWVLYRLLRLLAGTKALQIVLGVLVLAAVYVAAVALKFGMIAYWLGILFTYGAIVALVLFQPELRTALARLGQTRLFGRLVPGDDTVASQVAEAVDRLSRQGAGAIIVIEQEVGLDEYIATGSAMRATVSADLVVTIFSPYSPLHDGAVIIRGDRIIGAGCILPLTQAPLADRSLGTRHRAALGLSDETDATIIVVSEETAAISIARRSRLIRGLTPEQVRLWLAEGHLPEPAPEQAPAAVD
ncbi:MAG: diadenylate cyclase CdaA [Gemmatimonadota bacterium]